jgi:hypothetical protein
MEIPKSKKRLTEQTKPNLASHRVAVKDFSNQSSMINLSKSGLDQKRSSLLASGTSGMGSKHDWGLLDSEKATYGDRCPKGYEKVKLLGKGGCAIVWLAKQTSTGKTVALKQFPKPKNQVGTAALDPSARNEIEIGQKLF